LITGKVQNASASWVENTNQQISGTESDINNQMLGWARESTLAVNNTLNTFVNVTVTTIKDVFGNTPLEGPILDVLNCIVLSKIEGIQDGLTFVNENAKVTLPRVDNGTLALNSSNGVSLQAASQDASSSLLNIILDVAQKWDDAIHRQIILAAILLAVYGVVVLMGLARVLYALRKTERNRGDGGGLSSFAAHGFAWARSRINPSYPVNPFEDSRYQNETAMPGPTPSYNSRDAYSKE